MEKINLCGKGCGSCPDYDPETGMVVENGIEIDPEYILSEWENRKEGQDTINVLGIEINEQHIQNLIEIMQSLY